MKKLLAGSLVVLLACASNGLGQSTSSSQTQSNQTSDQPGAGGVGNSSTGDAATGPAQSGRSAAGQSSSATQTPGSRRNSLGGSSQALSSQGGGLEQHIATCLALGNQEEVALAQFAQQRTQNPEVKQFAQTMIEQHQQALQQLQQAAPQLASMNLQLTAGSGAQSGQAGQSGSSSRSASATSGQGATGSTATAGADRSTASGSTSSSTSDASTSGNQRGASAGGEHQQMAEFAREVKQTCLNLTQQDLSRKQGAEFDKCYIGQQIVAHTQMLAELQTAQRHVSGQMQSLIQQGTQMTEHHLAQAKSIMQQLDAASPGAAATAGRPAASSTQ